MPAKGTFKITNYFCIGRYKQGGSLVLQKFTRQTLNVRLKLWGAILILLPSLLMALIFAITSLKNEKASSLPRLQKTTLLQKQYLESWLNSSHTMLLNIASSDAFRSSDIGLMKKNIELALFNNHTFDNVFYINATGRVLINTKSTQDIVVDENFIAKIPQGCGFVNDVYNECINGPALIFSEHIFGYNREYKGLLVGVISLSTIDNLMKQFHYGKTGEVYLVNADGMRLTMPRNMTVLESIGAFHSIRDFHYKVDSFGISNALNGNDDVSFYKNYRGIDVIGAYIWMPSINCAIISEIDANEVFSPIHEQLTTMIVSLILVLLITFPITQAMVRSIKRPIEQLIDASKHIQKKDYTYRIDSKSVSSAPWELKRLCKTYNDMAATINEHQVKMAEIIEKRTHELKQLNEQLIKEIDERKQAELTMQQSREKYRMVFENANDAIFLVSLNKDCSFNAVVEVNNFACKRLGYAKDEILNLKLADLKQLIDINHIKSLREKLLDKQRILFETTILSKNNCLIPVEMSFQQFELNGQAMLLGVARDLTERKQMEKEFLRFDRLNLVGEMAAGIGHEVRNPLTTVRGFLQVLKRKDDDQKNAAYFDIMIEELDRANAIITEYLSLAKNKAVNKRLCNINTIVEALKPLLEADGLVQNKFFKLFLSEVSELMLDEKEIRQLILNLSRNGFEAMCDGGCLTIKTYQDDNCVILEVSDEGSGIPPEVIEKIGTPFLTTKEQGTGLGLAVCYSIAHRHKAEITFDTSDKGTAFYVRFMKNT